ncbi:MAG: PKD domain-containing protein, partial [Promethearchaeota archaeon]
NPEDYNWHPVPKTNGPYYGLIEEPMEFQGETGGENPPFTYYWEFGDDTISTEQNPSHSYSNPGEYTIKLTVTDVNGKSITVETYAWIQESNSPPSTPTIEGSPEVVKGEYCWYNITFDDPDGSPLYLYAVAFGRESNIWWGPYPPTWYKELLHFYWDEEGNYLWC